MLPEIASKLEDLQGPSNSGPASQKTLDQLAQHIAQLAKELTGVTGILPSYDQRQCELVSVLMGFTNDERVRVMTDGFNL